VDGRVVPSDVVQAGGVQITDPSKRAAADQRLGPPEQNLSVNVITFFFFTILIACAPPLHLHRVVLEHYRESTEFFVKFLQLEL
jgi:hypothetical protein